MVKNSRNKGNSFERLVAKKFTEWANSEWTFRRSPLSGGWEPRVQTGDIFPVELKDGLPFLIEVRKNQLLTLDTLHRNGIVMQWYEEKNKLYKGHRLKYKLPEKYLLFVMAKNNYQPIVVFNQEFLQNCIPWLDNNPIKYDAPYIQVNISNTNNYFVSDLDTFLKHWLDFNYIKAQVSK